MGSMSGPQWLAEVFAAVMLVVAPYCFARLLAHRLWSRPTDADVDLSHLLMGVAMAGMLVASLNFLGNRLWEFVFSVMTVWFAWQSWRLLSGRAMASEHYGHLAHHVTHVVMALAMLWMYLAPGGSSGAMMAPAGTTNDFLWIPFLLLLMLMASAVWELDGVYRRRAEVVGNPVAILAGVGGGAESESSSLADPVQTEELSSHHGGGFIAPGLQSACHVAMCVTMGYMLIVMI
jgi:hypothetical protein